MFPLLALGAFITGTVVVSAAVSGSSKPTEAKRTRPDPVDSPANPAGYVVIPLDQQGRDRKTAVPISELIGKWIF